jgi:hypothetical protein
MNFVRAEDTGCVFSRLESGNLYYAPSLGVPFSATELTLSQQGRLYHPAPRSIGGRALVASSILDSQLKDLLAIDERGNTTIEYGGSVHAIMPHDDKTQ